MKHVDLDNSVDGELTRVITWQYDQAENLVSVINLLKGLFGATTADFWDAMPSLIDISHEGTVSKPVSKFALAIWGRILSTGRPMVKVTSTGEKVPVTDELYRRILAARFRLLQSDASTVAYTIFAQTVFNGRVSVEDGYDMSLSFVWNDTVPTEVSTSEVWQMYALVTQSPDSFAVYPTGVRSHDQSTGPVFGFAEQVALVDSSGRATSLTGEKKIPTGAIQVVKTSVWVNLEGTSGATIPSGTKFSSYGSTFVIAAATTLTGGKARARFVADGEAYTPARFVSAPSGGATIKDGHIVSSGGTRLTQLTKAVNVLRSATDFKIATLDGGSFAWKRMFD